MDMGEHYGLSDLRQLISEPFPSHRNLPLPQQPHYGLFLLRSPAGDQVEEVVLSPPPNPIPESPPPPPLQQRQGGMDFFPGFGEEDFDGGGGAAASAAAAAAAACGGGGGSGSGGGGGFSHGRWPRQETLTLLEIRSRLDPKFKEAAQKAPVWDEVSRIMAEEHGYKRSGKKCREKLENLYKYYKKTKEGKAGRHDGKHYRFFRQLEALYGENTAHPTTDVNNASAEYPAFQMFTDPSSAQSNQEAVPSLKHCENLSFSSSSEFESSPSEGEVNGQDDFAFDAAAITGGDPARESRSYGQGVKRGRKSWKAKVREFIDLQLKRFMAVQEAWLEKMLASLEHKEQERMSREEVWRKQEAERFEQEHKLWARERAWIEARDAALIEALEKLSGRELMKPSASPEDTTSVGAGDDSDGTNQNEDHCEVLDANRRWQEEEITCLIQLRTAMEARFQEGACPKNTLWEEISAKMCGLGYGHSARRCKDKWENINKYFRKTKKCNKRRKENSRTCPYYKHLDYLYNQGGDVNWYQDNDVGGDRGEVAAAVAVDPPVDDVASPSNSNVEAATQEGCFPFLMDRVSLWEAGGLDAGGDDQH